LPTLEEPLSCHGVNGSIALSHDGFRLTQGRAYSQSRKIAYSDVSAVYVQRKSVVPSATLTILMAIIVLVGRFNLIWFVLDLSRIGIVISWIASGIGLVFAIVTLLRLLFVNVLVRCSGDPFVVRLVPVRSAKRLANRFSEFSAGV